MYDDVNAVKIRKQKYYASGGGICHKHYNEVILIVDPSGYGRHCY